MTVSQAASSSISSTEILPDQLIPDKHTCDHNDQNGISPSIQFDRIPEGTKFIALICVDYDVPPQRRKDETFYHWTLANIPVTRKDIAMGIKEFTDGTIIGNNTLEQLGWKGLCPPDKEHVYHFVALFYKVALNLKPGFTVEDLLNAFKITPADFKAAIKNTKGKPNVKSLLLIDIDRFAAPYNKRERRQSKENK